MPEFLRRLRLRPAVSFDDQGKPTFAFETGLAAADADDVIADLYGLLDEEAGRRPAVIVLDEFQAITAHGAHLPDLFKALADAHPRVSLVVAGSRRHLMERLVTSEGAPLYGVAQKLALGPIDEDVMVGFLRSRSTRGAGPWARRRAASSSSWPGRCPTTSSTWLMSPSSSRRSVSSAAVVAGLDQALSHEASTYAEISSPPARPGSGGS